MGFIRDMFRTAGEVSTLASQLKFSQDENERLLWQITELEKTVKAERAAKDKFVNKFCDQLSKQRGLPMVFKDKEPIRPLEPEKLSILEELNVERLAQQMIDEAVRTGDDSPPSLESCKELVLANRDQYEGLFS